MFNKTLLATTLLALTTTVASAQEPPPPGGGPTPPPPAAEPAAGEMWKAGTIGISVPFFSSSTIFFSPATITNPTTIDILYFLDGKSALDLIVGFDIFSTQIAATPPATGTTGKTFFGFAVGGGYRMYKHKGAMHGYLEPKLAFVWPDTSNSDFAALRLGFDFGLERTIVDWFSISGAVGGGISFGGINGFGKDINVATSAILAANFYFH
jgi:hypothetical protein